MKTRDYLACWTDGHDKGYLIFESAHRAGSAANREDAYRALKARRGRYAAARQIVKIYRYECDF